MKFYPYRLSAAVCALFVGISAVSFWSFKSIETNLTLQAVQPLTPIQTFPPAPQSRTENVLPPTGQATGKKRVPIEQHESFEGVILRLKKLAAFTGAGGRQTFYISDVENDGDGDFARAFARAYWKEKNAVIVLQLPVFDEPTDQELYWLSGKAYTDLNKDVVPEERGNMGCCLVTKAWADKAVKACKAGFKLQFNVKAQPNAQSKLRPSFGYWEKDAKNVPVRISRLSRNRKLAMAGDTLFMLDSRNQIVWTWTTGGAPLTDFPVMDSRGILYVIGYDLIWAALDSKTGKKLWQGSANGRAVYSQIELYKDDMYLVVTDMSGYRENSPLNTATKDNLTLCKGNGILWTTDIPIGSKIQVRGSEVFAVFKRKKRTTFQKIKMPKRFDKFFGTIDEFGFGKLK